MGLLSSVGGVLNDITGASSSAQQAQKYSKRLMKIQHGYNKEMMQNAHQWEVEDLQKAGLNPILSAGGSGATPVGGGLGGGATGQAGTNPIELLGGIISAKKALSEEENIQADTALKTAQTAEQNAKNPFIADYYKRQNALLASQTGLNSANAGLAVEKTWSEKGNYKNAIGRSTNLINSAGSVGKAIATKLGY